MIVNKWHSRQMVKECLLAEGQMVKECMLAEGQMVKECMQVARPPDGDMNG